MVLAEGKSKEECLKQLPKICDGCNGKLDFDSLEWIQGSRAVTGWIHCSISRRLQKDKGL